MKVRTNYSLERISIEKNISNLPPRLQQFVPVMIRENILFSYRRLAGIQTALTRINLRVTKKFSVGLAMAILNDMYDFFENDFRQYFPCLINVTKNYRKNCGTFLLPGLIKSFPWCVSLSVVEWTVWKVPVKSCVQKHPLPGLFLLFFHLLKTSEEALFRFSFGFPDSQPDRYSL